MALGFGQIHQGSYQHGEQVLHCVPTAVSPSPGVIAARWSCGVSWKWGYVNFALLASTGGFGSIDCPMPIVNFCRSTDDPLITLIGGRCACATGHGNNAGSELRFLLSEHLLLLICLAIVERRHAAVWPRAIAAMCPKELLRVLGDDLFNRTDEAGGGLFDIDLAVGTAH